MTQDPIITDEMKARVGVESEPSVYQIEREPIRRWAEAVGDPNPLYHDEDYAKSRGYRSIVAPPAFIFWYAFPVQGNAGISDSVLGPFSRLLMGSNEFEFFEPVQAGDTISAATKVTRLRRLGDKLFQIHETTYQNQDNQVVARSRINIISY